ncbi:MAG: hypothetical protein AAGB31_12280 [Bdellovibrio sp.]
MIYIFFFGFILLFYGGYILLGAFVGWGIVTAVALVLNAIFERIGSLFRNSKNQIAKVKTTKRVQLDDPIGVMSAVSHRYSDLYFLKSLAFLEVELFGANSAEVTGWFKSAEGDSRPEVCGAYAVKILLFLAHARRCSIEKNQWSDQQEKIWSNGTPWEFQELVSISYEARSA